MEELDNNQIDSDLEATSTPEVEEQKSGYIDNPEDYTRITGKPIETFKPKEVWDEVGDYKKRLADQETELKKWRETANNMAFMYKRMGEQQEAEVQQRLNELQNKVLEANANGDFAQAAQYQQNYNTEAYQAYAVAQEQRKQADNAEMLAFMERNKDWYDQSNPQVNAQVQVLWNRISKLPGATLPAVLQQIESEMRALYLPSSRSGNQSPHISRTQSSSNKSSQEVTGRLPSKHRADYETMLAFYNANNIKYTEADHIEKLRRDGVL